MRKSIIILSFMPVLLASCGDTPTVKKSEVVNGMELKLLFEKDGCRMYYFNHGGHSIYWSTCEGRIDWQTETTRKTGSTYTTDTTDHTVITNKPRKFRE